MVALLRLLRVARTVLPAACLLATEIAASAQPAARMVSSGSESYPLHPVTVRQRPALPSPHRTPDGLEVVTARTDGQTYVIVPVTVTPGIAIRPWEAPLAVDGEDFPTLARTGQHSETELDRLRSITGRPLAEINDLARPGRLSGAGFIAEDEDIVSVLKGDNALAAALGLTHAELARPLLHVCHLLRELYSETGATHKLTLFYGGRQLTVEVSFSRGGQKSIFQDGLDGAWTIRIRSDLDERERTLLNARYGRLDAERRAGMIAHLTELMTGEIEPFYIFRYGFYEGHTEWRTDPIAIAFMFGLRSIDAIEAAFTGRLDQMLARHFVRDGGPPAPSMNGGRLASR